MAISLKTTAISLKKRPSTDLAERGQRRRRTLFTSGLQLPSRPLADRQWSWRTLTVINGASCGLPSLRSGSAFGVSGSFGFVDSWWPLASVDAATSSWIVDTLCPSDRVPSKTPFVWGVDTMN